MGGGAPANNAPQWFLKGFTLAEVLITLGIIGVVAAMTFPILLGKYKKVVATTQLKKIYAILMNAYYMSEEENGESEYWVYPMSHEGEHNNTNQDRIMKFYNTYYSPYLNFDITISIRDDRTYEFYNFNHVPTTFKSDAKVQVKSPDGMCIYLWANNQFFVFTADLNCESGPNVVGTDIFDIAELYWRGNKTLVVPELSEITDSVKRQQYIDECKNFTYQSGTPNPCFAIFVYDGWQFKKDYPWR